MAMNKSCEERVRERVRETVSRKLEQFLKVFYNDGNIIALGTAKDPNCIAQMKKEVYIVQNYLFSFRII